MGLSSASLALVVLLHGALMAYRGLNLATPLGQSLLLIQTFRT
jgi:hypothetical protein